MMSLDPKSKKLEEQLEQRVRKLEDQMTILKNQIQNSLLEIQEVLATRFYHSTLRPTDDGGDDDEEVSPPPSRWGGHESSASPQPGGQASVPEARTPGPKEQPTPDAPPPMAPKVRKVSLDDIRRSRQGSIGTNEEIHAQGNGFDLVAFAEMVNWVRTSTARVGNAYTREAIDACSTDGSIAPDVADQLRQLIRDDAPGGTRDDVEPDEVVAVTTELRAILSRNARV